MAELPNSPPAANQPQPTGPVFHKDVAKVRVTSGGSLQTAEFKGKTFAREGEAVEVGKLGWNHADLAAAEADPNIVIERYNKNDKLVKKNGMPYPTVDDLTPKPAKKKDED